jgi:hypothetical protein
MALPPESTVAMICSFECTFCSACVAEVLSNVCPNCGGGFCPRPIRPAHNRRGDNHLGKYPAAEKVRHRPVDPVAQERLVAEIGAIPPAER